MSYQRRRELGLAFQARVREQCAQRGLTLARVSVHVRTDKATCPTLETVERVARLLGCSPLDLLPWEASG